MKGKVVLIIIAVVIATLLLAEVLALLQLKSNVSSYAKYWQKQNNTSQGEILYVALGDSTAQGLGASSPEKGYVGLVAKALEQKKGKSVRLVNLSISGARIPDVTNKLLPQLKELPITNDTVVTLSIGANDLQQHDEKLFAQNIDDLFSKLPAQTAAADIAYFGGGRYRRLEPDVVKSNAIIATAAQKYHLRLAHLHEVTQATEHFGVHGVDYLHPSNIGYKNWAAAFEQTLGI